MGSENERFKTFRSLQLNMVLLFASQARIIALAGPNVDLTFSNSSAAVTAWGENAQSMVNIRTRQDWNTIYPTLKDSVKHLPEETADAAAAINLIEQNMSGYTSQEEAATMLDVLKYTVDRGLSILSDQKSVTFIKANAS